MSKTAFWIIIPQLFVLGCLIALVGRLGIENNYTAGSLLYLFLYYCLRSYIPFYHRKGSLLMKKGCYNEAVTYFEKSYVFFRAAPWLDTYRYLLLLSSSQVSYTEKALLNMADCYEWSGSRKSAKAVLVKASVEFPLSQTVKTALHKLVSAENTIES